MENQIVKNEKNITDKVLNQVSIMTKEQGLKLPSTYNVSNALKSAYLKLAETNLLNGDQISLAQALLNMVVQGLNPSKNQCYFINYGGKITLMRSYFGDRTACLNAGLVKDIQANVIYEGDEVNVDYIDGYLKVEHKTKWENWNNKIIGAYAIAIMPDETRMYDLMSIERIKKSWAMSKNQSNNKLQQQFTDDACKRTVIRHLVKNIFNQSIDNNPTINSYCESTDNEYDYSKPTPEENLNAIKEEQKNKSNKVINATINEVANEPQPNATQVNHNEVENEPQEEFLDEDDFDFDLNK